MLMFVSNTTHLVCNISHFSVKLDIWITNFLFFKNCVKFEKADFC